MTLVRAFTDDGWQTIAGVPLVRGPFAFAYDTPGLNDGVEFYTPTVGDLLMDIRVVIDEAFNGATPTGDVNGLFAAGDGNFALTPADEVVGGVRIGHYDADLIGQVAYANAYTASLNPFTTDDPLVVWVSQNGVRGGSAIGGTAGAARIYIATATPLGFA